MFTVIITSILLLQLAAFIFNFGVLFACFQRRELLSADKNRSHHAIHAILYSLPGLIAILTVLAKSNFPRYGFRYSFKENDEDWVERKDELVYRVKKTRESQRRESFKHGGKCRSIW